MLPHRVVIHRLDHRERHSLPSEIVKRMFDEEPTNTASSHGLIDRQIRYAALASSVVYARANVAENLIEFLCNKNTCRIRLDVLVDMSRFSPTPVMAT